MSKPIRITILLVILAAALFFLVVPPERIWPGNLPFATFDGSFAGEPVSIPMASTSIEGDAVPVQVRISMPVGACEVSRAGRGDEDLMFTMGSGSWRDNLPADETLILDPRGFSGSYNVVVGYPYHPLAPSLRIVVLGSIALVVGVALVLPLFPRVLPRLRGREKKTSGTRERLVVGSIMFASFLLYSIVHELGHVVFGLLAGGTLRRVVWTVFFFEEPHVEFVTLPQGWGSAWMAAGGVILPTLAGLSIVALWLAHRTRLPFLASALVVVPGLALLLGNLGGPIEAAQFMAGGGTPHLIPLGIELGLGVLGTALLSSSPAGLTVAAYMLVFRAIRNPRSADSESRSREQ